MAEAVSYCDRCGRLIPPSEAGQALVAGGVTVCASCAKSLSPEERARFAARGEGGTTAGTRRSAAGPPGARRRRTERGARTERLPRGAAGVPAGGRASGAKGEGRSPAGPGTPAGRGKSPAPVADGGRASPRGAAPASRPPPTAEVPGGARRGAPLVFLATAGAGVLGSLAVGLLVVSARKQPRHEGPGPGPDEDRTATPGLAPPPSAPPSRPPSLPPAPPPPTSTASTASTASAETAARARLDEIAGWRDRSLRRYDEMRGALEALQKESPGTPAAAEAGRLLAELDAEYDKLAGEALRRACEAADDCAARGDYGAAQSIVRSVRMSLSSEHWLRTKGEEAIRAALEKIAAKAGAGGWQYIKAPGKWEDAGGRFAEYDGCAWYRCFVKVPAEWEGRELRLELGCVDDCDVTYFNGARLGGMDVWDHRRTYRVEPRHVRAGKWNLISLQVVDTGGEGGFVRGPLGLFEPQGGGLSLEGDWQIRIGDYAGWARWPADPDTPEGEAAARAYHEEARDPVGKR